MKSSKPTSRARCAGRSTGMIGLVFALAVGCSASTPRPASDSGTAARGTEGAPAVPQPAPVLPDALELLERARELARGDAAAREKALMAYARAEDALRERMDEVHSKRDQAGIEAVEPVYKQCIQESDELLYALFDKARIERTPWRDLFETPTSVAHDSLAVFTNENHTIRAATETGIRHDGLFSIGGFEHWRDFVLETEFVLVRGETKLHWRCGKEVAWTADMVPIEEATGFRPGETYRLTATYLGSRRTFEWSPNAERELEYLDPVAWRRSRVGPFVAVLGEDSEIRITGLRVRVLRAGR